MYEIKKCLPEMIKKSPASMSGNIQRVTITSSPSPVGPQRRDNLRSASFLEVFKM